jgi:hypothetical protein
MNEFERTYNKLFRTRGVDTSHIADCEQIWHAAIARRIEELEEALAEAHRFAGVLLEEIGEIGRDRSQKLLDSLVSGKKAHADLLPRPSEPARMPLTEEQILEALRSFDGLVKQVPVLLTYEGGPNGASRPTWIIKRLCHAIEVAHGIGSESQPSEGASAARFVVAIDGWPRQVFDTADQAIGYAAALVHHSGDGLARAMKALEAGQMAQWQYGFSIVTIYPPQDQCPASGEDHYAAVNGKPAIGLEGAKAHAQALPAPLDLAPTMSRDDFVDHYMALVSTALEAKRGWAFRDDGERTWYAGVVGDLHGKRVAKALADGDAVSQAALSSYPDLIDSMEAAGGLETANRR